MTIYLKYILKKIQFNIIEDSESQIDRIQSNNVNIEILLLQGFNHPLY